jgi:hypothetical protein
MPAQHIRLLVPPIPRVFPVQRYQYSSKKPATRDARQFVQAQKGKFSSAPAATHSNDSNYNVLLCGVLYSFHEEGFVFIFCEKVYFRSKNAYFVDGSACLL